MTLCAGYSATKFQWGFICPFLYENLVNKKEVQNAHPKGLSGGVFRSGFFCVESLILSCCPRLARQRLQHFVEFEL